MTEYYAAKLVNGKLERIAQTLTEMGALNHCRKNNSYRGWKPDHVVVIVNDGVERIKRVGDYATVESKKMYYNIRHYSARTTRAL